VIPINKIDKENKHTPLNKLYHSRLYPEKRKSKRRRNKKKEKEIFIGLLLEIAMISSTHLLLIDIRSIY